MQTGKANRKELFRLAFHIYIQRNIVRKLG